MKRNKLALIALLAALSSFGVSSANALTEPQISNIKREIAGVPVPELAPKAAEIVRKASANDREEVAVTVVRSIVSQKPVVARDVVIAIVKAAPEVSAAVASTAAKLVPDQAALIAKEAAAYAPEEAHSIAAAVAKVSPNKAVLITKVAVAANPEAAPKVMEAVVFAVPSAKETIENDATLKVVNTLVRNTRSSASFGSRIISNIPRIVTLQPPEPIAPNPLPRSASLVTAINDIRTLDALVPAAERGSISAVAVDAVKTINAINADTSLTATEKSAILLATSGTAKAVVSDPSLTGEQKGQAGVAASQAVRVVVQDTGISADVKKIFIDFTAQKINQLVAETGTTGLALGESIKSVAGEVQKVIEAVQNITPAQAQQALVAVEQKVEQVKNEYSSTTSP